MINEVLANLYLDSVALMRLSRAIAARDGVEQAALMMGTPANKQIMADAGLLQRPSEICGGGDLIIGIRAVDAAAAAGALEEARGLLARPRAAGAEGAAWAPRTLRAALKTAPEANLALISVPGGFAVAEARKAIRRGLHAMIFSDNVEIAEEAALKREARELGCLVMGPDCGTAIIAGVPLAFANRVPRGDIGVIGASGTGTQEVTCLIAKGGGGISHAIGVGGRDLEEAVGGISTLMALEAFEADPESSHVVLVSKPPSASVGAQVIGRIARSSKQFTVCFIGAGELALPDNATQATTLKAAALSALGGKGLEPDIGMSAPETVPAAARPLLIGLFSGGTLCAEAQVIFKAAGEAVASNAPIPGVPKLAEANGAHPMIDLGDDEYTSGKPHPMIDPTARDGALVDALRDEAVGVVLVDVVIGYGAHADPAGHVARIVLDHRRESGPVVVASVTGTEADPQGRSAQVAKLEAAGVHVAPCNADAAALALASLRRSGWEI